MLLLLPQAFAFPRSVVFISDSRIILLSILKSLARGLPMPHNASSAEEDHSKYHSCNAKGESGPHRVLVRSKLRGAWGVRAGLVHVHAERGGRAAQLGVEDNCADGYADRGAKLYSLDCASSAM